MAKFFIPVEGVKWFTTSFATVRLAIEDAELKLLACSFSLSPASWTVHITDPKGLRTIVHLNVSLKPIKKIG
ncbi:MAG: hypothetical protein PVJ38_01940, partial [Candidatus Bathyarchaeota archaeon]